jgi:hypothetical protein
MTAPTDSQLAHLQSVVFSFLLLADGEIPDEFTQGAAGGLLSTAFGLSDSQALYTLGQASEDLGSMSADERARTLQGCIESIKATQSIEGRQSLFNQLEIIAKGGMATDGKLRRSKTTPKQAELLSLIQLEWGVTAGMVDRALGHSGSNSGPAASGAGSSGCLVFVGLAAGLMAALH